MIDIKEMKERIRNDLAIDGEQFLAPTGAIGKYMATLSPRGKIQAEFNCIINGCKVTHIREISDWQQCGKCHGHAKIRLRDLNRKRTKAATLTPMSADDIKSDLQKKLEDLKQYASSHNIKLDETSKDDQTNDLQQM